MAKQNVQHGRPGRPRKKDTPRQKFVASAKRIVVKVGSATLVDEIGLNRPLIERLIGELIQLRNAGKEIILVTSGAVSSGIKELDFRQLQKLNNPAVKRAMASVGQALLMETYRKLFGASKIKVGQVLVTNEDFVERKRFLNVRNTLSALMEMGILPIVNENDTVTTEEIAIGDNDNIAALIAACIDADLLVLLTDVDGVYTDDPRKNKDAKLLKEVKLGTAEAEKIVQGGAYYGVGGVKTKMEAVTKAANSGIATVIASGTKAGSLQKIVNAEDVGTLFLPSEPSEQMKQREQWLAFASKMRGTIVVDIGARDALLAGKSLLPVGIVDVRGVFDKRAVVGVADLKGEVFAKGITNYSSDEILKIKGKKLADAQSEIGDRRKEVVGSKELILLYKM